MLNHFDIDGNAIMVNVSEKGMTERKAVAKGRIRMKKETLTTILEGRVKKGDVLAIARIAGIMGCKRTADLIPLCHPIPLEHCTVSFQIYEDACEVEAICTTLTTGKTGVEMEAMTGASTALLTIYDMCKAIDRGMEIHSVCVHLKSGGNSGVYCRDEE